MTGIRYGRMVLPLALLGLVVVVLVNLSSGPEQSVRAGAKSAAAPAGKPGGPETAGPVRPAPDEPRTPVEVREGGAGLTGAQLVSSSGLGWATTPAGLLVTTDAGSAWRNWGLPVPTNSVLGVALLGPSRALVAASKGTSAVVVSTGDGGKSWTENDLGPILGGPADGGFAYAGDRVAGLLVQRTTSSNFSQADWFSTPDSGATWLRHDAPVAGDVSLTESGAVWLAGGPTHSQLFRSSDAGATWSTVAVPTVASAGGISFGAPVPSSTGLTTLAVTVPAEGDATSVVALTSRDDGRTWQEVGRTRLSVSTGTGTPIPASAKGNTLLVAAPNGEVVFQVPLAANGAQATLSPTGLPAGVDHIAFATDQLGWASFSSTSCRPDKTSCTRVTGLVVTRDGGGTWQRSDPVAG